MKLVYMIDSIGTSLAGTENQLLKMISGLDALGFEVSLIVFKNTPWLSENAKSLPCKTHVLEINQFKQPGTYLNILKLVSLLKSIKPDVVHTFFPTANIVGVIAARLAKVKVVVSSRRDYGEWMRSHYLQATKFANRFVDKITTNSFQVGHLTHEIEGVSQGEIKVIYNGIDVAKFSNLKRNDEMKRALGIPETDKVVVIIANFRPMKRHYTFVKAAREILNQRQDVSFLLIGRGTMMEDTKKLADELKMADKMVFAGARDDVIDLLPIVDVGTNCSEAEGLSNAIMEYMCAGIPCVISNGGGNPDLVRNGENGFLFDVDDYQSMAKSILTLLEDDSLREQFVDNSKQFMNENMAIDVVMHKYAELYREIFNSK